MTGEHQGQKKANKGRDMFEVKRDFSSLSSVDGRIDKHDNRRFRVVTFLEAEDNAKELLESMKNKDRIREKEDIVDWNCEQDNRMNDQVHNFLCFNANNEALTMVKKMKSGVNRVACSRKFNHECQTYTVQRIWGLANAINEAHRAKKYVSVEVVVERWGTQCMSRTGAYWVDQPKYSSSVDDRTLIFPLSSTTGKETHELLNSKISCMPTVWEGGTSKAATSNIEFIYVGFMPGFGERDRRGGSDKEGGHLGVPEKQNRAHVPENFHNEVAGEDAC